MSSVPKSDSAASLRQSPRSRCAKGPAGAPCQRRRLQEDERGGEASRHSGSDGVVASVAPVTPPGRLRPAAAAGVGEAGGLRATTFDGGPPRGTLPVISVCCTKATVCRRCRLSIGKSSGGWRGAVVVARTSAWRSQSMVPLVDRLFVLSTAALKGAARPR